MGIHDHIELLRKLYQITKYLYIHKSEEFLITDIEKIYLFFEKKGLILKTYNLIDDKKFQLF